MTLPIIFNSSLPRSGSTLLQNILGQNPAFHVTPTNGLIGLIMGIRDSWQDMIEFRAQPQDTTLHRIVSSMRGVIEGFYTKEFADGKIVSDKSRGWLAYTELLEEILGQPPTILTTVRDVRSIVASFEKLYRRNPVTVRREADYCKAQTLEGRCELLLGDGGPVGIAINRLRDALRRAKPNSIYIIPYDSLTIAPKVVMNSLHEQLGWSKFDYDFDNIQQVTYEDDAVHGLPLHKIRNKVEPQQGCSWDGVLTDKIAEFINTEFADIQSLAK